MVSTGRLDAASAAAVKKQLAVGSAPILFSASEPLGVDELWRAILKAASAPRTKRGRHSTGKLTERAMKHLAWAS